MGSIIHSGPSMSSSEQDVTKIFNSYIAASAIGAAWEVGLLDEIRKGKPVNVDKFAAQHDLDLRSTQGAVVALSAAEVLQRDGAFVSPGRLLEDAYRTKSLFHWLALGSGSVFSRMQSMLRNENRSGDYYSRNSAAIAYACRDANAHFIDSVFLDALSKVDYEFRAAADLGSGSGERLMQILDRYPASTAVGIDIAGPAVELARVGAHERGYGGRITFLEGDARRVEYRDDFSDVDLLTSFLMGHDFWPRENCVDSLRRLRRAFPSVKRFFLCDTVRISVGDPASRHAVGDDALPIFTLGFELGHALMGVKLPTVEDWEGVFEDGGWRCVEQHHVCPPSLTVLFELVPLEAET
ncbi:Phenylpyruvate C(3)-methyltransferase [Colletotrichum orbiculare MAFF 240422]|uniref:Phenylpyruvate C(3)-methyltransferase n=1 Tax=Colletotrichum orbiculare (strain 104-T / ATCC 96160 / CBS 514.97 / LARS 414 / MAFF 240422) TaxID=1213857 RepID=N4V3Y0_COLOR|nr:Phenylpyruvate C(3)-methyltransferase [Colletotrichum orbiculare MAFF 240422]